MDCSSKCIFCDCQVSIWSRSFRLTVPQGEVSPTPGKLASFARSFKMPKSFAAFFEHSAASMNVRPTLGLYFLNLRLSPLPFKQDGAQHPRRSRTSGHQSPSEVAAWYRILVCDYERNNHEYKRGILKREDACSTKSFLQVWNRLNQVRLLEMTSQHLT